MAKLRLVALAQDEGDDEIMISRSVDDLRERVAVGIAKDDYR